MVYTKMYKTLHVYQWIAREKRISDSGGTLENGAMLQYDRFIGGTDYSELVSSHSNEDIGRKTHRAILFI